MSLLTVTLYAALAALAAALGPWFATGYSPEDRAVGMANAIAAGTMLGLAYPLMRDGLDSRTVMATVGASAAVVVLLLVHIYFNIDGAESLSPGRALTAAAVHAAPEGLALGVSCAVDPRFGVVVASALALHNIGEAMALSSHLVRSEGTLRASLSAAASNLPQVALGMAGYLLAVAYPEARAALLGAAAGSLIYLSLADLLPDSYHAVGRTAISVIVIAATSVVAFAGAA